ncbi:hypothetical protein D3C86_2070110 [compost metagenome]
MQLQATDGPHVVDVAFHSGFQRLSLGVAGHQNHHFLSVEQRAHAHGQCKLRYQANVAAKEAGVGDAGILGQGLDASARGQR